MFEGLIVDLLNNYLGKYIQNLDRDNLRLGIFNGNIPRVVTLFSHLK